MDRLIDSLLREPFENSVAALYVDGRTNDHGYTDHELLLAVNPQDQLGGLRYLDGSGSCYASGRPSRHDELAYYYMGSDRPFPLDSELPLESVRQAARPFLAGGDRPSNVRWLPWPDGIA